MEQGATVLEMKGIVKRFPGVRALNNVHLSVKKGSVHALMGENGAGKSTLMKILIGMYEPDEGEITLDGKPLPRGIKESLNAGISMIHQELSYVPHMTVAENMFLGLEPRSRWFGWVDRKRMIARTREILSLVGSDLDPNTLMSRLSVSERQMVEIAKAVSYNAKLIIMDEPTSAISDREVEKLFGIIRDLREQGVSVIYISHKMDEIYRIADEFTVLRDGTHVGTHAIRDADMDRMISMMVGRELTELFPERQPKPGPKVLEVSKLSKAGVFEDISFSVRKGEIVGLAGLMGAGRTDVVNCIFGLVPSDSGDIYIHGRKTDVRNPMDGIRNGIGLVSEDRKTVGLVLQLSVRENISLPNYRLCSRYSWISTVKEKKLADNAIADLSIKTPNREQKVKNLSGGNQQKIVFGKMLLTDPDILILDEPTRGIDIGAKKEIYQLIGRLADEGKAIIMVSSELPEILGMSDRIVVLHDGRVSGEVSRSDASEETIMRYAFGK